MENIDLPNPPLAEETNTQENTTPPQTETSLLGKLKANWPVVLGTLGSLVLFAVIIYAMYSYGRRGEGVQPTPMQTPAPIPTVSFSPTSIPSSTESPTPTPTPVIPTLEEYKTTTLDLWGGPSTTKSIKLTIPSHAEVKKLESNEEKQTAFSDKYSFFDQFLVNGNGFTMAIGLFTEVVNPESYQTVVEVGANSIDEEIVRVLRPEDSTIWIYSSEVATKGQCSGMTLFKAPCGKPYISDVGYSSPGTIFLSSKCKVTTDDALKLCDQIVRSIEVN